MNTTTLLGSVTAYAEVLNTLDAYTQASGNAQACHALTRVTTDQAERVSLTGRAGWHAMRADALYLNLVAQHDAARRRHDEHQIPSREE